MKVEIPRGTRLIRIELLENGTWRIWTAANPDFALGTYYDCAKDASVTRVTERVDGVDELTIK